MRMEGVEGGGWRVCVRVCNVECNIRRPGKKAFLLVMSLRVATTCLLTEIDSLLRMSKMNKG